MSDTQAKEVPLVERLRSISVKYVAKYMLGVGLQSVSHNVPIGKYAHEAADTIELLERELLHADAELAKVLADNEALRADAERYRWLRRKGGPELMYGREQYTRACLVCGNVETDLDAAIDKER